MKKLLLVLIVSLLTIGAVAQSNPLTATYSATVYKNWKGVVLSGNSATGAQTIMIATDGISVAGQAMPKNPLLSLPLIMVDADAVTPTAVSCGVAPPAGYALSSSSFVCNVTATFAAVHGVNAPVISNDGGVREAVKDACTYGGVVKVGNTSGATTANITGAPGCAIASIEDNRNGAQAQYFWNGTAYAVTEAPFISANYATLIPFVNEEEITLSTGSTNSDSTANLLPAKSLILAVTGRVTTAITGSCTGWTLADPTTAGRFAASDTTLTKDETSVGVVHATTGIASATTGLYQSAAAKVRIVCAGGNAAAGKVRVTVFGYTITPAAQ